MNRNVLHIIVSIVCITLPIIFLIYNLWDINQPKIGAVGDGKPNYPTLPQMIPSVCCFLLGAVNLPLSIRRYNQNKKTQQNDKRNED